MKKIILLTVILISQYILQAQTLEKLDEKNGFKTLKLGTYKKDLNGLLFNSQDNIKKYYVYEYMNPPIELSSVFDIKFDKLYLMFDDSNKLIGIRLSKKYTEKMQKIFLDDALNITLKYISSIGKATYKIGNNSTEIGQGWKGKKVRLEVKTTSQDTGSELTVHYFSESFVSKMLDNGF
ncbi:MAG: hypothetical protein K0Q95_2098 [Bacteroidota bacterium]|jgi:hypothetical protein|nr:hypothetical protein [Bacteroidota bacterium]